MKSYPSDESAEKYILGACFNSKDALNDAMMNLTTSDFFFAHSQELFIAMQHLYQQGTEVSVPMIAHSINTLNLSLTIANLIDIQNASWSGIDHQAFIKILKEKSRLRSLILLSQQLIHDIDSKEADPLLLIQKTQDLLMTLIGYESKSSSSYFDKLQNYRDQRTFYEEYQHILDLKSQNLPTSSGILTGYKIFDKALGGFQKQSLHLCGAYTHSGKTTLVCNFIHRISKNHKVGFFSLEMPTSQIVKKLACIEAKCKPAHYDDGELSSGQMESIKNLIGSPTTKNVIIDDASSITLAQLEGRAFKMRSLGCEIIFIDYLTRIKPNSGYQSKHLEVDSITKGLQALAKKLDLPIVVLAQLNRQSQMKKEPSLSDFRESGSIEEDSDICFFLNRRHSDEPGRGISEISILKNRTRGILKKIEFTCHYNQNEILNESREITQEMKKKSLSEILESGDSNVG